MSLILQSCSFDQTECHCPANGSIVLLFSSCQKKHLFYSFFFISHMFTYPTCIPSHTSVREKGRDLTHNTKTPPKTSITQRLRIDLGRSVWATTVDPLVGINRFTSAQPSHLPQQLCNQTDTRLKTLKTCKYSSL